MEILNQLEEHVAIILAKLESLKAENSTLNVQAESVSALEAEIQSLRKEVDEERQKNQTALARVDALVQRIKAMPE